MDQAKARELYDKYGFLIYSRCKRILRSEDDARDAMQEVFLKLLGHYNAFKSNEHVIPWIYTVSKNHCFNMLRENKKFISGYCMENLTDGELTDKTFTDTDILQKVLASHSKKVQEAVYYTYIENLNQTEICTLTGQSPATIRRNLNRFKQSIPHIKKRLGIE